MTALTLICFAASYLLGSLPNGYWVVRLRTGQDLRECGSGRTGGTNALRAGGLAAGALTGALDICKGMLAVWLTRWLISGQFWQPTTLPWLEAAAAVAVVVGHNWSIFLGLRGGAGTGPNVGAAIALWPASGLVLPAFVPLVLIATGYASVASLLTAALIPASLLIAARLAGLPVEYAGGGIMTGVVVAWALRPNVERLLAGKERRVRLGGDRIVLREQGG